MKAIQANWARFGIFELDLRAGELHGNGQSVLLSEQVFQVLHVLLSGEGELVTRDELKKKLWPNDTVVEFEHGINNTIKRLRKLLDDSAEMPRYIETIPRRGYRLMVAVEWWEESEAEAYSESSDTDAEAASKAKLRVGRLTGSRVSHYRVLEVIGGGGMGLVYRAEDLKLNRAVALKFLPEEVGEDANARERFQREAHAVSALDHPNICTIYDFDEYEGHPFIAMQLLQGKTLRDHLIDGRLRLSQPEGLDIAIQIACGLEAAHEKGIIHRDIKPANIFITDKNVAKILDFGVAKVMEASDQQESAAVAGAVSGANPSQATSIKPAAMNLTRTGLKLGTAGYMSPEQIRGESLDSRTDIFSFGLVLYEMATGERAFTGQTEAMLHDAILNHEPKPWRESAPELSPKLAAIVDKSLEKSRDQRFPSAQEVRRQLEDLEREPGVADREWFRAAWIAAAVLLVIGLTVGTYYWRSHRAQAPLKGTNKDTVILADFKNSTGDPAFDGTLKQALAIRLEQSPYVHVLSDQNVSQTLQLLHQPQVDRLTEPMARQVCLRTNNKAFLTGSLSKVGEHYLLTARAVNCETGNLLGSAEAEAANRDDVVKTLGEVSDQISKKLGETLPSVQQPYGFMPENVTGSLEAVQALVQAVNLRLNEGRLAEAMPYYRRAVELDPTFALGYLNLGVAYGGMGNLTLQSQYMTRAYELRNRVTPVERAAIEAMYYAIVTGELEKAVDSEQEWARLYAGKPDGPMNLTQTYFNLAEYEKAAVQAREAIRVGGQGGVSSYDTLMWAYMSMDRLADAQAAFDETQGRKLDDQFISPRYSLAFLQGDRAAMDQQLQKAMGKPQEAEMLSAEADTQSYYGHIRKARELTAQAVQSARHSSVNEATIYKVAQAGREAEVGNAGWSRQNTPKVEWESMDRYLVSSIAFSLARAGDASRASEIADKLDHDFPVDTNVQRCWLPTVRGAIALARYDPEGALRELMPSVPLERGCQFKPVYLRGLAYLAAGQPQPAAVEFQKILDHTGRVQNDFPGALSHLQLGRAQVMMGDKAAARKSYEDFLALWKDADPDIPIYRQAKSEYAELQ